MDYSIFDSITTFIFDVDGVLTDSMVHITESGELLRNMNTRDGQAIKIALNNGYRVAIITKGASKGVKLRLQGLGITDIYDKLDTKQAAFDQFMQEYQLTKEEVLYMGDDLPDLPILAQVGLSTCPYNACREVLDKAMYISPLDGGKGCVRDVIERVMRTQQKWKF